MKRFRNYTDQELARVFSLIIMSDEDFSLRFLNPADKGEDSLTESPPALPEEH